MDIDRMNNGWNVSQNKYVTISKKANIGKKTQKPQYTLMEQNGGNSRHNDMKNAGHA